MSLNPFKSSKKTGDSKKMLLEDNFLISIKHPDDAIQEQIDFLDRQFEENPQAMISTGMELPFIETQPYVSLFTFENIMMLINGIDKNTTLGNLPPEISIVEYDYPAPDSKGRVPEAKEIVEEKRLNYRQPSGIKNFEHLPHLIAEAIMNFPDERADYEDRVAYITMILDFYDKKYGVPFSKIFGIRPTVAEAIVLPSESVYAKTISNKNHVDVVGLTANEEPEAKAEDDPKPKPEAAPKPVPTDDSVDTPMKDPKPAPVPPVAPKRPKAPKKNTGRIVSQNLEFDESLSDITVPLNEVGSHIIIPDEDDRDFVKQSVQNDLKRMNEQRLSLQETLNSNNRQKITEFIAKLQGELSKPLITKESTTALLEAVTQKVDQELEDNFKQSYELRLGEINNKKDSAITEENKRHDSVIADIEHQATAETNSLTQTLHSENEAKRGSMIEDGLEKAKQSRDEKAEAEVAAIKAKMLVTVQNLANELRANSQSAIDQLINQQTTRIDQNTQKYHVIHEKAVESHTKQMIAEREANVDINVQKDLADLQAIAESYKNQARLAENAKAELEAEVRGLKNNQAQAIAMNNQGIPGFMMNPYNSANQVQASHTEATNESKEKAKRGKNLVTFTVGAAVLLGIGGFMYSQNVSAQKQDEEQTKYVHKLESALSSDKVVLKSSSSSITSTSSSQSTQAPGSSSQASSTSVSLDTLDTDVAGGNLNVYDQYYKNSDLKTEARTLLVGRLLINSGRTADAQSLAKANAGHNSLLISELNN